MNSFYSTDQILPEAVETIFPEKRIRDCILSCFPDSRFGIWCEVLINLKLFISFLRVTIKFFKNKLLCKNMGKFIV
jgi:hypothetical protein